MLKAAGIPIPPSWFTIDPPLAKAVANRTPLIVKPYARHKTSDVRVINSPKDLEGFSSLADPVLIQKYVKKSPEDLKIYVVGERTFPVRKVYSPDRRDLMGRECTVSEEIREIALKCGKLLRLLLAGGVDVDPGETVGAELVEPRPRLGDDLAGRAHTGAPDAGEARHGY